MKTFCDNLYNEDLYVITAFYSNLSKVLQDISLQELKFGVVKYYNIRAIPHAIRDHGKHLTLIALLHLIVDTTF